MALCVLQTSTTVSGAVCRITTNYLHMSVQEARLSQGPWGMPLQRLKGHTATKCSQSSAWLVQSYSTENSWALKSPQKKTEMEPCYIQMKILTYQSQPTPFSLSALERLQLLLCFTKLLPSAAVSKVLCPTPVALQRKRASSALKICSHLTGV